MGSIPGLGRSPGGGNGYPLQQSCLENSLDRRVWWATVHGISKESDTTQQQNSNKSPVWEVMFAIFITQMGKLRFTENKLIFKKILSSIKNKANAFDWLFQFACLDQAPDKAQPFQLMHILACQACLIYKHLLSFCLSSSFLSLLPSFFFKKYLFIYLTALGLSCSMWDLVP